MRDHRDIDGRSLALARAVAERIDADPHKEGLRRARQICARWCATSRASAAAEWELILAQPWDRIRHVLLDEGEVGQRLRQSSPFCGILTNQERWRIYREFADDA